MSATCTSRAKHVCNLFPSNRLGIRRRFRRFKICDVIFVPTCCAAATAEPGWVCYKMPSAHQNSGWDAARDCPPSHIRGWRIVMRKSTDRILEMLRDCPSGLTAREVADRLGADQSNIGSRLSKLAAYGIISKTRGRISSSASPCAIYFTPTAQGRLAIPLGSPS
jgi:hypothetical protein